MITSNAYLPREHKAAQVTQEILTKLKFPVERIQVSIDFDYLLSEPSANKVEVSKQGRNMEGSVLVKYSGLCLWQDPKSFLDESIPHELAHVMDEISSMSSMTKVQQPHGDHWLEWVSKIDSSLIIGASHDGEYDFRPQRLIKGGIPVRCDCEGVDGLVVLSNNSSTRGKLLSEEAECLDCGAPYVSIRISEVEEQINSQVEFVRDAAVRTSANENTENNS